MRSPMIVYDIETLKGPGDVEGGWENPEGMGFGTATAYFYDSDQYMFYGPEDKDHLLAKLCLCEGKVISFNGIRFDNKVMLGNSYKIGQKWEDYDILLIAVQSKFGVSTVKEAEEQFGPKAVHDGSMGLNGLSQGTLGLQKTGKGEFAPALIRAGRWPEVYAYNLNDVRLTQMLYDFSQRYGYLVDGHGKKIEIQKDK